MKVLPSDGNRRTSALAKSTDDTHTADILQHINEWPHLPQRIFAVVSNRVVDKVQILENFLLNDQRDDYTRKPSRVPQSDSDS